MPVTSKAALEVAGGHRVRGASLGRRALGGDLRDRTSGSRGRAGALGELPLALSQRVYVAPLRRRADDGGRRSSTRSGRAKPRRRAVNLDAVRCGRTRRSARPRIRGDRAHRTRAAPTWRAEARGSGSRARLGAGGPVQRPRPLRRGSRRGRFGAPNTRTTSAPWNWGMVELIEAVVRAGTPELAADVLSRLAEMPGRAGPTGRSGSPRAQRRSWPTISEPRHSTSRRSTDSAERGWQSISLAPTSSTANG